MSMLSHMKATPKNDTKPDAKRIPIGLTLYEVSFIVRLKFFFVYKKTKL